MNTAYFRSPIGWLQLEVEAEQVFAVSLVARGGNASGGSSSTMKKLKRQLLEYFSGQRTVFDLPMAQRGTVFQTKVWRQLSRIPFGQALSYGQVAAKIGQKGAARAIGGACNKNPWIIIVPCHRVLAAHRAIGGYSPGLPPKRILLNLEGIQVSDTVSS